MPATSQNFLPEVLRLADLQLWKLLPYLDTELPRLVTNLQ